MDKISFEEAANILQVTRITIYNYIKKKLLTPYKAFNGRVFFDPLEVEKLRETTVKGG